MPTLEQLQRTTDRMARRLGVVPSPRVAWANVPGATCQIRGSVLAHAHPGSGQICFRPEYGFDADWQSAKDIEWIVRHEVAHFVNGGHGLKHAEAMAAAGDRNALRRLQRRGKRRCGRHEWVAGRIIEERWTERGLTRTHSARCHKCGKQIGAAS